jgi:hypothetical protein
MNIFYLSKDPVESAQMMLDKHVVKMILETAQLLSTAHRVLDGTETITAGWVDEFGIKHKKKKHWVLDDNRDSILYRATHINHPSAIWCRNSVENYNWLVDHFFALDAEYRYRYEKTQSHASIIKMGYELQSPPFNLKQTDFTEMPCCMPDHLVIAGDPVASYRSYYIHEKMYIKKYTKRPPPEWFVAQQ